MIFSDEKTFNFNGPDGIMVWASIGYNGNTEIKFISGKRNSKNYLDLIKDQLDNYALHISDTGFIFQQDNAAIHNSKLV